jgi:hypothetical protein
MLSFHPDPLQYQALQEARLQQKTPDFKAKYARRAGIEGTISQGVRGFDLRHARYRGLTKTRLQHQFVGGFPQPGAYGCLAHGNTSCSDPLLGVCKGHACDVAPSRCLRVRQWYHHFGKNLR